eukprot:m.263708 g.263708  ORF g.263708 m.263708 type:complete len:99 (-) comp16012_c0_seq7:608-904(-)
MAEAVRLFRLSVDQEHTEAQYHLGFCYESGEGVLEDKTEAARLYRLSAELLKAHQGADAASRVLPHRHWGRMEPGDGCVLPEPVPQPRRQYPHELLAS